MTNKIGQTLKIIGGIIIGIGLILGFVIASETHSYIRGFSWLPTLYTIISSFVIGMLFIGFGEVINILHEINLKIEPGENSTMSKEYLSANATDESGGQEDHDWESDPRDHSQIQEFFANREDSIEEIIKTPFESIYAVKTSSGVYLLEAGGFKAKFVSDGERPEMKEWVERNLD